MSKTSSSLSSPLPGKGSMISLTDLQLKLGSGAGEVNILRGINLEINKGETVSLVGPSGSGKTSLLMVLAGLERATHGDIAVSERDFNQMSEDDLSLFRRDNVGIVFQSFHLVPTMTALENTAIPLELAGRRDAFKRAEAMLEAVGLGHRLNHYPGQLSGGEQQRVALARAFVAEPHLILADEPTGNLDGETGQQIIELMFKLSKTHDTTLLLITHDPALAKRCDRVVRMADGHIIEDDKSADASNTATKTPSKAAGV